MIEDDKLIRLNKVYVDSDSRGLYYFTKDIVITKEEFIECYNTWIKEKEG